MKDLIRMNQLAGIITESQARKMMQILNENEDNALSPKMQKQFNMIVSAIKNAKSEKDIDRIHTNLMLLPKKLTKIFINKLVNMGLAEKEGDEQYSLSYDDGLDEAKKMMKILNEENEENDLPTKPEKSFVPKYILQRFKTRGTSEIQPQHKEFVDKQIKYLKSNNNYRNLSGAQYASALGQGYNAWKEGDDAYIVIHPYYYKLKI